MQLDRNSKRKVKKENHGVLNVLPRDFENQGTQSQDRDQPIFNLKNVVNFKITLFKKLIKTTCSNSREVIALIIFHITYPNRKKRLKD